MELYRKELKLAVIKGLDESRGSSNVPIKLTHDTSDEYINYTEQIHIRYLFDNQLKEEILPTNDNGFYIPGKPLSHDGPIELAVHLINGDIELVTNELSFVVKNAPNGTTQVDPSEFTWQQLVDQYVNAKLDTFANKLDLSKFEETVNGSIENQNQNIESFKTEVNANLSNQDKKITDLQNTTKVSLDSQNTKIDNFKSEVNTSLSNQNTSINQTTSAQNSKITTLESRMDTFTSLSEGSTTGDAELKDIRVGANGVTYNNAGDAVRGQYSQLKEDLVHMRDESKIDYSQYGLPTLYLVGNTDGMSKKNKKTLSYKFAGRNGTCQMKWQGSSSINYPKKNYTITFDSDFEAKAGWGYHNKYCLKANWIDCSHARNIVSAKLWGQIVKNRNYEDIDLTFSDSSIFTDENNNHISVNGNPLGDLVNGGAIDGFPIVIDLNNEFLGLYTFNIPKDRYMFGMGSTNVNQGFIVGTSNDMGTPSRFQKSAYCDGSIGDFEIEYCSTEDTTWLLNIVNNLIAKCKECYTLEKYNDVKNLVDIDSAIEYMIFQSLILGADWCKNQIILTKDGEKLAFSAYDLDTTFGNYWDGTSYYKNDYQPTFETWEYIGTHVLFSRIIQFDKQRVKEKYNELRNTILSEENILFMFTNYMVNIPYSILAEDWKLWKTIPGTLSNNLSQIVKQFELRSKLLDKQIYNL